MGIEVAHMLVLTTDLRGTKSLEIVYLKVICIIFSICVILQIIFSVINNVLKSKSPLVKKIVDLNDKYEFTYCIQNEIYCEVMKDTKRQYDNFSLDKYVSEHIKKNYETYVELITKVEENRRLYDEYKNLKYTSKQDIENLRVNYFLLHVFEKRLYRKLELLEPPLEINMEIVVMYVSPTGRNRYKKSIVVPYKQIKEQYLKHERKINKMYI